MALLFAAATLLSAVAAGPDDPTPPPPGCPIPASYTFTDFFWYNSSTNLNCVEYQPDTNYYDVACLNAKGQWCESDPQFGCSNCNVPVCADSSPPNPLGFGPNDRITISYDGHVCQSSNSNGSKTKNVGWDNVPCDDPKIELDFFGNSEPLYNNNTIHLYLPAVTCEDGRQVHPGYRGTFNTTCTHDDGHNATCTAVGPIVIPLTVATLTTPDNDGDGNENGDGD